MVPIVLLPPVPKDQVMVGSKGAVPVNATESCTVDPCVRLTHVEAPPEPPGAPAGHVTDCAAGAVTRMLVSCPNAGPASTNAISKKKTRLDWLE